MARALSLLLNELVTFQTIISGHFIHCLTFLPNNLFDFPCDVLRLFGSCRLRLMSLLLFRLGLRLGFCLLAALGLWGIYLVGSRLAGRRAGCGATAPWPWLDWAATPRTALIPPTPPGPEGSKGTRALAGVRGVLTGTARVRS